MAKGKRPTQPQSAPWIRWAGILVGLAIAGAIVWWVARPSSQDAAPGATAEEPAGAGPRPLDMSGAGGPTVDAAATLDAPAESLAAAGPDAPSGIDISNDPRLGSPGAPVTIVEMSDFQCPFCGRFHRETFPALQRLYGDQVRWVFVNFPLPGHQYAMPAAIAGECATRQGKFWEFAEYVFTNQERLDQDLLREEVPDAIGLEDDAYLACVTNEETASEIAADRAEAERLGVGSTPTFYVNGQQVVGAQPVGVFNQIIGPYFAR